MTELKQTPLNITEKDKSDSSSTGSIENISVSIAEEQGTSVTVCLKVFGLQPKSSVTRWYYRLGKPTDPECLVANAKVKQWKLTNNSFKCLMHVKTDRKAAKKHQKQQKKGNNDETKNEKQKEVQSGSGATQPDELGPGWERFHLKLHALPSEINPEHCSFSVEHPAGRDYCFIMMELKKKDTSTSWQMYLRDNGSLDAAMN